MHWSRFRNVSALASLVVVCIGAIACGSTAPRETGPPVDSAGPGEAREASCPTRISEVQGTKHSSTLRGHHVEVCGIVTLAAERGFYFEQTMADWDEDPSTSEAIYVFAPDHSRAPGDLLRVRGVVEEAADEAQGLTLTQLVAEAVELQDGGRPLPEPVVIGAAGRPLPAHIADNTPFSAQAPLRPSDASLDFFESLEAMRVEVQEPEAVAGTSRRGELALVSDGAGSDLPRTVFGGVLGSTDSRATPPLILDDDFAEPSPLVAAGDRFSGRVRGVLGYRDGRYVMWRTEALPRVDAGPAFRDATGWSGDDGSITVATLNTANLSARSGGRIDAMAAILVEQLHSPDVVALQEIQDDDGTGTTTLSAGLTYQRLTDAVARQGGPRYDFAEVMPEYADADGGEPNGNIRVGFLYRLDRVTLTPRGDGDSGLATEFSVLDGRVLLTQNPGRIAPLDAAWNRQRKPLVAELVVLDTRIFFVNVHFISRLGDDPPFGPTQPPAEPSALRRTVQARVVAAFIERLLTLDPGARVVVLGDFNDTEDSEALHILERAGTENLTLREPLAERYTYNHLGTSEALDHVLVSSSLATGADIDTIRLGADFAHTLRTTDHDAVAVRLSVR